jgi:signal transduction histidine kinase
MSEENRVSVSLAQTRLDAVFALGRSINILATYGSQHSVFLQAISATRLALQRTFVDEEKIDLSCSEEGLLLDDIPVDQESVLVQAICDGLIRLNLQRLSISQGVMEEELAHLTGLLANGKPEMLKDSTFSHIQMQVYEAEPSGPAASSELDNLAERLSQQFSASEAIHKKDHLLEESAEASDITKGLDTLSELFGELEDLVKSDVSNGSQRIENILELATENLDDTVYSTREKLENLSKQITSTEDTGIIDGQGAAMDRNELLSSISEISQELMQPLTAITTLLEMLLSGYAGDLNHDQQTMLTIASNSGEHLTFLMKELIDIVGYPVNTGVDDRFHTTSEQVVQQK